MEIFKIEFLPVQFLPEKVLKALQKVLVNYDKASLSSFAVLHNAYQILVKNKKILIHKNKLLKESIKHTLFTSDKLNGKQLEIYESFVKIFLEDIKALYLAHK